MDDMISRQAAVEAINKALDRQTLLNRFVRKVAIDAIEQLPPAHEPLTDKEQRIFLAAMGRERKVCKEVDDKYDGDVLLTKVCSEIERKVKAALWS